MGDSRQWTAAVAAEFENNEDCVKLVGLDGRVLWMNAGGLCAMEIGSFDEIKDRQWTDLWPEEARPAIRSAIVKAAIGMTAQLDAFCPTMKGNLRRWNVSVSAVNDSGGSPLGYIAISRDITDPE